MHKIYGEHQNVKQISESGDIVCCLNGVNEKSRWRLLLLYPEPDCFQGIELYALHMIALHLPYDQC